MKKDSLFEKYRRHIHNINMPEWPLLQEMTVSEVAKRNKAIQPGTLLREIVANVHAIWKKKGRLPWGKK